MPKLTWWDRLTKAWWSDSERANRYVWQCFFTGLGALLSLVAFPVALLTARRWAAWQLTRSHAIAHLFARSSERPPPLTASTRRQLGWLAFHAVVGTLLGAVGTVGWGLVMSMSVVLIAWITDPSTTDPPLLANLLVGLSVTPWQAALVLATGLGLSVALPALLSPSAARFHATRTVALLGPSRVDVLTATRSNALDAHSAELRRIERDLHDGTQAQLVALTMRLGLAEQKLAEDPRAVARLLAEARGGAEEAMTDLREVVRTMYPPILADRGLAGAVSGLAARSVIPTEVTADDLGDLPAPVEAAAYFVVAEALTNAAKHSGATQVLVHLDRERDSLHVQVTDDGLGGVDESQGTGIVGIRRRVAALDGHTTIHSPLGGGTTITVEIPCGS